MPLQISQVKSQVVHSTTLPMSPSEIRISQIRAQVIWSREGFNPPPIVAISQVKAQVIYSSEIPDYGDTFFSTCISVTEG